MWQQLLLAVILIITFFFSFLSQYLGPVSVKDSKISEERGEELTLQLLKTSMKETEQNQNGRNVTLLFTPRDVFVTDMQGKVIKRSDLLC